MPSCYCRTDFHDLQHTFKENDLLYQMNGYTIPVPPSSTVNQPSKSLSNGKAITCNTHTKYNFVQRRYFCGGSYCFKSWCLKFCDVGASCMLSYFYLHLGN